jgi:hypothetical protein
MMNPKIKETAKSIPHWNVYDNGGHGEIIYDSLPYGAGSHIDGASINEFAERIIRETIALFHDTGEASSLAEYVHNNIAQERILKHWNLK